MKFFRALYIIISLLLIADLQASDLASAFKERLSAEPKVKEINFKVKKKGQPPEYYAGAIDGENFYLRRYISGENLYALLTPTNEPVFPFFFGSIDGKKWEITGLNVIETTGSSNSISVLVAQAKDLLSVGLNLGISNLKPGSAIWTNLSFTGKRGGPKVDKIEQHHIINGHDEIILVDVEHVKGTLICDGEKPTKLNMDSGTFYFDFTNNEAALSYGVPSIVTRCRKNAEKYDQALVVTMYAYKTGEEIDKSLFNPYAKIDAKYLRIASRSDQTENLKLVKDNSLVLSKQNAIVSRQGYAYKYRIAIGTMLFVASISLLILARFRRKMVKTNNHNRVKMIKTK